MSGNGRRTTALRLAAVLVGVIGAALLGANGPAAASPPPQSASSLIDQVNQFRASKGMGPLHVDPILMQVAQRQADYCVSIGELTHYGPDGSRPRDQAIAAGYGGGTTVFVSENIAMGTGLSEGGAVDMWTGDDPHLNTMLGQYYRDVGAGVGSVGDQNYYILITGYVAGGLSAHSTAPAPGSGSSAGYIVQPIVTATPLADGSIVHVVQEGQTLWTIAAVYGIDLTQLLNLNGMTQDSLVHPGDRVIVRAAPTTTPTPAPSPTPSPSPGPTVPASATAPPPSAGQAMLNKAAALNSRDVLAAACVAAWIVAVVAGLVIAVRRM